MNDKRLIINYVSLTFFVAELIHVSTTEQRAQLLGECVLNLHPESLADIKAELIALRVDDAEAMKVAA